MLSARSKRRRIPLTSVIGALPDTAETDRPAELIAVSGQDLERLAGGIDD